MYNNATIIALAWPNTKVVKEGKWYDIPMKWLGVIKNNYYNAGHAAFLLINHQNSNVHYFDYGRYHTPIYHGRVRDKETDPDVAVNLKAEIKNKMIVNIEQLLLDRFNNKACHGEGKLTAAIVKNIHFEKAFKKAKEMQNREAIPYGPFQAKGSTCSRFVTQVVVASSNNWLTKLLIQLPYTISPTPRSNNKVLNECSHFYEVVDGKIIQKRSKFYGFKKLLLPKKHYSIRMDENVSSIYLVSETA
ncbi:MAG: hypothetical protein CO118_04095 [Flavobacteriales bacterium CG_4_9_14_3_um_filter_32_8]|nr:MAG: hypothetical protein CO118_04095 [Flavobacteriales bacterium CG_4_9_14_3_um_filter_32_8]